MKEQEIRACLRRVMAELDASRGSVARYARKLCVGGSVLVATVTTSGCFGPCHMGPNVLVYPEGVMYGGVSKGDIPEIIEQHLLGDQPVERLLAPEDIWS